MTSFAQFDQIIHLLVANGVVVFPPGTANLRLTNGPSNLCICACTLINHDFDLVKRTGHTVGVSQLRIPVKLHTVLGKLAEAFQLAAAMLLRRSSLWNHIIILHIWG